MTSIYLALDLIRLLQGPADLTEIGCPGCGTDIEVHQPDPRRPVRLLGVCPSCAAWYLIDAERGVLCRLPDEEALIDA
jgi:hypothetical protein